MVDPDFAAWLREIEARVDGAVGYERDRLEDVYQQTVDRRDVKHIRVNRVDVAWLIRELKKRIESEV